MNELPVSDYDDNTEFTDDDSEVDGVDEIDDDINGCDIDENSSHYDDHSIVVGTANMDDD